MDGASHALIPLQGSHALISLQSQLHQRGLHNPLCLCRSDHPGPVRTEAKLARSQATGTTCSNSPGGCFQRLIGTEDQYVVQEQMGWDFFLAGSLAKAKTMRCIRLHRSSEATRIDYARV